MRCFQVSLEEDSESPPVVFKSSHYSITLLKSAILRLYIFRQSNGYEIPTGCGSDCISRIMSEGEPISYISQDISTSSLRGSLAWTTVTVLD